MTEHFRLTAAHAQPLLRSGNLTVEAYAISLLNRIQARDPAVHAWAYLDPEYVLAQAKKLDQIPAESRGPLHGVAIGVKDIILTKDMPTGYNSPIYANLPPVLVDAAGVITLRAAGALLLGKTATTEFATRAGGGPCTNPHDSKRTPGGSSSGSAAAVADFQLPIALATQTIGSIVRPSSFNGVYGFKPTWGAMSREGLAQYSPTNDTLGACARSVEDLELLSSVFQIADDEPVPSTPFLVKDAKIAFCKTAVWSKAGAGTKAAWTKAQDLLSAHGAQVDNLELPAEFDKIHAWQGVVSSCEARVSFLGNRLIAEEKLHPHILSMLDDAAGHSRKTYLEAFDGCASLRSKWDEIASGYDAIMTPSAIDEAPLGLHSTGDPVFCAIWTILHAPALNVPGFKGDNGMPVGLTLVGPRYRDCHVLHAGKGIGKVFESEGGFQSSL